MSICERCMSIAPGIAGAPGHPALRIIDTQRQKIPGSPSVTVRIFRCLTCGTVWRYREAKRDEVGWRLLGDKFQ